MRSKLVVAALAGAAVVLLVVLFALTREKPTSTTPAATVNGSTISQHDVIAELDAIAGNEAYAEGAHIHGTESGTYDPAFVADVLQRAIVHELIRAEVARLGLHSDGECKVAARGNAIAALGGGSVSTGQPVFDAFPEPYQDQLVQWDLDELVLTAHLADQECVSPDAAKAYYEAHLSEFEEACLSISQIPTADAAAGDFVSLGCKPKNQIPTDFLSAAFETPVGQVSHPVQTTEGFALIRVDDRRQLPLDQVREQASELAAVAATNAFNQWLQQAVVSATITVDPHYGTWNQQQLRIDPPT